MRKLYCRKPYFLLYMVMGFCYLSFFLAILCFWQSRQIRMMEQRRQDEYRILAQAEAEEALHIFTENAESARVYHALRTSAEYLAMSAVSPQMTASLQTVSQRYLETGAITEEDMMLLRRISMGEFPEESSVHERTPDTTANDRLRKCRETAEAIIGVHGIFRQVCQESNTTVFYFQNGYIRIRTEDAVPLEWVISLKQAENTLLPISVLQQKAARCIPQYTLDIRNIQAAEDGYWMHFSGKAGTGRLFIRSGDGRVTHFFTDTFS